jgi:hypothetical protein
VRRRHAAPWRGTTSVSDGMTGPRAAGWGGSEGPLNPKPLTLLLFLK